MKSTAPRFYRLDSQYSTFFVDATGTGVPACRYWGPRLGPDADPECLSLLHQLARVPSGLDQPVRLSLFPTLGFGFWGHAAFEGNRRETHWAHEFQLTHIEYRDNHLSISLEDPIAKLALSLEFVMDTTTNVLKSRTRLTNRGDNAFDLRWCAAACLPLPAVRMELLVFQGAWTQEFQIQRILFPNTCWVRKNRRGRTSHDSFPGLMVGTHGFGADSGDLYAFHLGWSGNHHLLAESLKEGERQIQLGELLMPGEVILSPGESYTSPWAYACFARGGTNAVSRQLHQFVRQRILPTQVAKKTRKVMFNTWEAIYFDHDPAVLNLMAVKAADLGIELFVLDDGWFSQRSDDASALGDWDPDSQKYPEGLSTLIKRVQSLGMDFGLWLEPEMVNPDSNLYRRHPDWVLQLQDRPLPLARNQLVLDLSQAPVTAYLFDTLDRLLRRYPITYIKWDMNRDLCAAGHQGRAAYRRQTLAHYDLIDRLRAAHPGVEIETCASGGARVDYEILRRTERVWTSDCNDAFERHAIQQGFTLFFPPEIMGTHVGPAISHTSGRRLSLNFRAHTAFLGHFGIECDLRELDDNQLAELKTHIANHKQWRDLLRRGTYVRLTPADENRLAYGLVGPDRNRAIYLIVQLAKAKPNTSNLIRLSGLDPKQHYRLKLMRPLDPSVEKYLTNRKAWVETGLVANGQSLQEAGFALRLQFPETSVLLQVERE